MVKELYNHIGKIYFRKLNRGEKRRVNANICLLVAHNTVTRL